MESSCLSVQHKFAHSELNLHLLTLDLEDVLSALSQGPKMKSLSEHTLSDRQSLK